MSQAILVSFMFIFWFGLVLNPQFDMTRSRPEKLFIPTSHPELNLRKGILTIRVRNPFFDPILLSGLTDSVCFSIPGKFLITRFLSQGEDRLLLEKRKNTSRVGVGGDQFEVLQKMLKQHLPFLQYHRVQF